MTIKKKRLRPLVKTPKGGRFTAKQVRDALKALEKKLTLLGETNECQVYG